MIAQQKMLQDTINTQTVNGFEFSTAAIAIVEMAHNSKGRPTGYCISLANSAFLRLVDQEDLSAGYPVSKISILDCRKTRSMMRTALKFGAVESATIFHRQQVRSLVLNISVSPVDGLLVITINDVTSLSHAREMLEQQTTLMDENNRALEMVRASLEAEISRRSKLEEKLRRLADTDALSGLANRRRFMERASSEFRRSRRYGHVMSLVMLDLDRFKNINDTHGHGAGDTVITAIGQICQSLSRIGIDVAGRVGGEEFAILLPETDKTGAQNFAERVRLVIETTPVFADITKIEVTASMGVATLLDDDHDLSTIMKRADDALYKSKNAGRNMVSVG